MLTGNPNSRYREMNSHVWVLRLEDELYKAKAPLHILDIVKNSKSVDDYENLYRNFMNLSPLQKSYINDAWQLLVLSGESAAFNYAVNQLGLDKTLTNENGENALHLAALSGCEPQIDRALRLGIPWKSKTNDGSSLLHYATLTGQVNFLHSLFKRFNEAEIDSLYSNNNQQTLLHLAAYTGKIDLVDYLLKFTESRRELKIDSCDHEGFNPLNYAIKSGNIRVINRLAEKMKLSEDQENFHFGDLSVNDESYQLRSNQKI